MAATRIKPKEAKHDMQVADALLVCAYDSQEKFEDNHLAGAISLDALKSRESDLAKDREVIFYCG